MQRRCPCGAAGLLDSVTRQVKTCPHLFSFLSKLPRNASQSLELSVPQESCSWSAGDSGALT